MSPRWQGFIEVVGGTTLLACVLGICIDVVTANLAVEYFTEKHPSVIDSTNSWAMAILWGVIASWWFGAIAGVVVGAVNASRREPLPPDAILRWAVIACVVVWMLMMAVVCGIYIFSCFVAIEQRNSTFDFSRRLMAVALAHQTEYILGGIGTIAVAIKAWLKS